MIGLRLLERLCIISQHLKQQKSSQMRCAAVCSSAQILRTPRNVSITVRDGTTPDNYDIYIRSPQANSPVLIGGISVSPTRGNSGILEVLNKRQSTSQSSSSNTQNFDTSVDRKLANDGYSTSIFSKIISRELSHSPSADFYFWCCMDFTNKAVGTEAQNFVDLEILAVNALDEFNTFSTPATRIRGKTEGTLLVWSKSYFWKSYSGWNERYKVRTRI